MFKYNKETGEIMRCPLIDGAVITEPNCIYRQALNKKNFIKKLRREGVIK